MSSAQLKDRHYAQLAATLHGMAREISNTQKHFNVMAGQLDSMAKLGALHASQFMAVARLLDVEELEGTKGPEPTPPPRSPVDDSIITNS